MGWWALAALLLCGLDGGTPPAPTPLVIVVDAGAAPPDPQPPDDPELLDDLDLLREYELLKVYPLLAPE